MLIVSVTHYAYWSSDVKDYELVVAKDRYPGDPRSYCNVDMTKPAKDCENHFGLTLTKMLEDSLTICPVAFTETAEPYDTIADAVQSDMVKGSRRTLRNNAPRSLTLLHELVHLIGEPENTLDNACE